MSIADPSESEQIERLKRELEWAHLKIRVLEERLRLERIAKYGPKSEKLSDAQLELLDGEPGVSTVEVETESGREALPIITPAAGSESKPTKARKHPGRQQLPAHLTRVERVIECTPEQCVCQGCGQPNVVIGYEATEQLDVEPARYFVVVSKREKRACQACGQGVNTAAAPKRIIEKGLVCRGR